MAAKAEQVVDSIMGGEKALRTCLSDFNLRRRRLAWG